MGAKRRRIGVGPLELHVAEHRMDGAVAYGMDRGGLAASPALWDDVVVFDAPAERAAAQEAAYL